MIHVLKIWPEPFELIRLGVKTAEVHVLKIWPEPFELIRLGVKTAEVRSEGGRTFRAGDVLRLEEFMPKGEVTGTYTGRVLMAHVTDLLRCSETPGDWGLQSGGGIVVMSLQLLAPDSKGERSGWCDRCGGKRWCQRCER
jgi:ASC-1-like (ASCH) protein